MRSGCGSRCAGCAGPISTWPRATCRCVGPASCPVTRSSAWSTASGPGPPGSSIGDRIGIAWLRSTCGTCRFCRRGDENLCLAPRFTGWDEDGGYAEHAVVDEAYAYPLPDAFADDEAAPLLCAGIIGYRALRRAELPDGGRLGIYGFGGSAHLAAQVALAEGASVYVMTRSADARALASDLGAAWVGDTFDRPPEPLDAAICFAPAGEIVPAALEALDRGGTLAVAGIHLTDIPPLDYQRHLFQERQVRSVTANTREDGEAFLAIGRPHRHPGDDHALPPGRGRPGPGRPGPRPRPRRRRPPRRRSLDRFDPAPDAGVRARESGARTVGGGP